MKRFWHTCLAVVASAAMVSTANAQTGWNQSGDIGSYQSILKRAGYGTPPSQDAVPAAPGESAAASESVVTGEATQGCAGGDCGTAMVGGCGADCDTGVGRMFDRAGSSDSNIVVGLRGLYFSRDHEDDVFISENAAGDVLLSTNANYNTMGGFEVDLTKRNCNGSGFQFVYWGLYPGQQYAEIVGPGLNHQVTGLADVFVDPGGQDLLTYFNGAESNFAFRESDIHNIEANLLRNGGTFTTRGGRAGNYEMIGGFRWFQFNELFGIGAFNSGANPTSVDYEVDMHNTLLGFQIGGRRAYCVTDRFTLELTGKVGVFNNRVNGRQTVRDSNDLLGYRTAPGVDDYNYDYHKDDLAMLGELDLGFNYRLSCNCRISTGFRVLGVTGVALAANQYPSDFITDDVITTINSNSGLILAGGYAGLEYCF